MFLIYRPHVKLHNREDTYFMTPRCYCRCLISICQMDNQNKISHYNGKMRDKFYRLEKWASVNIF